MSEELDDYVYGRGHMVYIAAMVAARVEPEDSGERVCEILGEVVAQWSAAVEWLAEHPIGFRGEDGTLHASVELRDEEVVVMCRPPHP